MKLTFCEKYGFDESKRHGRLAAIGLGEDELALVDQVQRHVIEPKREQIISQFFRVLRLDDEVNRVFSRGFRQEKLENFLANYLLSMGVDFNQAKYFEQRLRMGIAHINAGVNLVVFQMAYRMLQQLLIDALPSEAKNEDLLRAFILKITTLDLIIATEVYQKYQTALKSEAQNESLSRGSLRKVLNEDQVSELLLTGLQQSTSESPGCIAVGRIDELEKVENVYGKETVDLVRQGVISRLLATLRPGDGVGLVAGQGFLFVLSHTTLDIAGEISKRLMACISDHPVSADKMTIPVTISLVLVAVDPDVEHKLHIQQLEQQLTNIQAKGINQLEILNGVVGR